MRSQQTSVTTKHSGFSNALFGNTFSKRARIMNEHGLHARPAAKIVAIAQNARSNVWIIKDNQKADAKSIIDILILCCQKGSIITIMVDDKPDIEVLDDIVQIVENESAD